MSAAVQPLEDSGACFVCGPQNPIGLHLTFAWNEDQYETFWTPEAAHQGWAGRVHGGLIATVLDEVLSRAALERYGLEWVTAELTTRLVQPALVGTPLHIIGRLETVRRRLIVSVGEVKVAATEKVIATGQAKLMRAN